jgi:hypothetical protein
MSWQVDNFITFVNEAKLNVRVSEFPPGAQIKGTFPPGASYWTRTTEIRAQQADGSSMSFFIKIYNSSITKKNARQAC